MITYKKSAWAIQGLSILIMIGMVVLTITRWFYPALYTFICNTGVPACHEFDIAPFSLTQKITGFMVEGIGAGLIFFGLALIIQLMEYIKNKEYFSLNTINLLKQITKISLVYVLYTPVSSSLLSVITSLHNEPGERIISLSFGSTDIFNILIFCFMFLIMTIFQKGYELEHEQKLTI